MTLNLKTISLVPKLSEKTFGLSQDRNVYTFKVPKTANKLTVERAVSSQFDVTVTSVRMANIKGKAKRTIRRRTRPVAGKTAGIKKAYVTLKAGDKLPIFLGEEDKAEKAKAREKK